MEIKLKQGDIEKALRTYLSDSGIDVAGRDVSFHFSMRRRPSELVADVEIAVTEDDETVREAPVATVTSQEPRGNELAKVAAEAAVAAFQEAPAASTPEAVETVAYPEPPAEEEAPADPPGDPAVAEVAEAPPTRSAKVSLFG